MLITVKAPDDRDPLNRIIAIGIRFRLTDGEEYGENIYLNVDDASEWNIIKAVEFLIGDAYSTEKELISHDDV